MFKPQVPGRCWTTAPDRKLGVLCVMCSGVGRRMLIWARSSSKDRSLCLASVLSLKRPSSELSLNTALARHTGPGQEDAGVCTKSSFDVHHPAKTWVTGLKGAVGGGGVQGGHLLGRTPPAAVGRQDRVPEPAKAARGMNCDGCVVWQ